LDTLKERDESQKVSPSASQEQLAKTLGYDSFSALCVASRRVATDQLRSWLVTCDANGSWVVWNYPELVIAATFATAPEAEEFARAKGSPSPSR
jgi:hypothetical protein